jgi:hypothetical protein
MSDTKGSALSNPCPTASGIAVPTASGIAPTASGIASKYERIILQNKCPMEEECSICLDSLYMKQIAYMPCKHAFHQKCIQYSFTKKLYSCPLCRYDLIEALKKTNFIFPIVYDPYTYDTFDPYTFDYNYIIYHDDDGMPPLIDADESFYRNNWSNIMVNIMQDTLISSRSRAAIPLWGLRPPTTTSIELAVGVGAGDGSGVGAETLAVGLEVGAERVEPIAEPGAEPSTDDDEITFNEFLIFFNYQNNLYME